MKIRIDNVRLAFPVLFTAKPGPNGGDPRFSATFIIPPNHPALATVRQAIKDVAKEKWGEKADNILKQLKAGNKLCLRSGEEKPDYEGFEGNYFVSSGNKGRPLVLDRDKTPLTQADGKPYAGCFVNATLDIWAQDHPQHGKRINASVTGVQFYKDGDAFAGGTVASEEDFEDLADTGGDGDEAGDDDLLG